MEEEPTAMDVEHLTTPPQSSSSSSLNPLSSNRFDLKNSVQTNFGNDYVFQISPKFDWSLMGVSLSSNVVKWYAPSMSQYYGECRGHSNSINQISFSGPSSQHLIVSSSSDGTIRVLRGAGPSQEIFSFSFGGSGDYILSVGCKSKVLFVPQHQNKLITASLDGLICSYDTAGDIDDDDHLESVINIGTSVGKVGIFGETYENLWCLTQIETLSIWDWKDGTNHARFQDARSSASDNWNQDHIDYFVDCRYGACKSLWVNGGTNAGVVRSILPLSTTAQPNAKKEGVFGWTGGEDGRLCCWFSNDSPDTGRSWMSSSLSLKSSKKHQKKSRHQPY